mgnify:CR=1 FL=1
MGQSFLCNLLLSDFRDYTGSYLVICYLCSRMKKRSNRSVNLQKKSNDWMLSLHKVGALLILICYSDLLCWFCLSDFTRFYASNLVTGKFNRSLNAKDSFLYKQSHY